MQSNMEEQDGDENNIGDEDEDEDREEYDDDDVACIWIDDGDDFFHIKFFMHIII